MDPARSQDRLLEQIRREARPLQGEHDVESVLELIGDARFVLLGEATHGTREFYRLRAEITRRLIVERGFDAVAVEADWPDALRVSRYIQGRSDAKDADEALGGFVRFPLWMWRNQEVRELVGWLRAHNDSLADPAEKAGFFGLDLYSLHSSMHAVIQYLEKADPEAAHQARERYGCFDNLAADPQKYGYASRFGLKADCEREVMQQLMDLLSPGGARTGTAPISDELFYAQENARVVRDAERYYRVMFEGGVRSWNLRDTHMADTLESLSAHLGRQRGRPPRVVVWAHNSHIGDARATELGDMGELNLGQLVRQRTAFGGQTFLLGFTTHRGTVAAADDWDEPVQFKRVTPSLPGSIEDLLHRAGPALCVSLRGALRAPLAASRLERAIGVVYRPDTERASHYFHASVSGQFDALMHLDETSPITPLDPPSRPVRPQEPETFPSGM